MFVNVAALLGKSDVDESDVQEIYDQLGALDRYVSLWKVVSGFVGDRDGYRTLYLGYLAAFENVEGCIEDGDVELRRQFLDQEYGRDYMRNGFDEVEWLVGCLVSFVVFCGFCFPLFLPLLHPGKVFWFFFPVRHGSVSLPCI